MVLWDVDEIAERVQALASEIDCYYDEQKASGIVAIVVMNGAFIFAADLLRTLSTRVLRTVFVRVSSYKGSHRASLPKMQTLGDLGHLHGAHVLVIEDIVDTGHTAVALRDVLSTFGPESLNMVTLLDKVTKRDPTRPFSPAFVGFTCPDQFVKGYGLDVDGEFRDLPWIADENG